MKKVLGILILVGLGLGQLAAADTPFLSGLSESERAQAGLDQLSAAQLAALEAAVQRYAAGRDEHVAATATAEVRTELAATREALEQERERSNVESTSLLDRARVMLTPGTKVEFSELSSTLTEPFQGWKTGTLFRLANGQTWRVVEGKYWSPREAAGKAIIIKPGMLGSFFIEIEGVRQTPRVELVSRK